MPSYAVETYIDRGRLRERRDREARARSAAAELTAEGTDVRFELALHLLEDETSFYVFSAPSAHQSAEAARLAGLDPIRVVQVLVSEMPPS